MSAKRLLLNAPAATGLRKMQVKKQSERQLGAFYFLYANQFSELPRFLDINKVVLRNEVVHQGKLASKLEAEEFGEYVFDYIKESLIFLNEKFGEDLPKYKSLRNNRICKKYYGKVSANPIDGENPNKEITNVYGQCFLNMDNIKTFSDCFIEINQLDCGLLK